MSGGGEPGCAGGTVVTASVSCGGRTTTEGVGCGAPSWSAGWARTSAGPPGWLADLGMAIGEDGPGVASSLECEGSTPASSPSLDPGLGSWLYPSLVAMTAATADMAAAIHATRAFTVHS